MAGNLSKNSYRNMLTKYPDLINMGQLQEILGVSRNAAYKLVREGKINFFRVGKLIRIPKRFLIDYIESECYNLLGESDLHCRNEEG
jgi:excisionase family DNA binding protein